MYVQGRVTEYLPFSFIIVIPSWIAHPGTNFKGKVFQVMIFLDNNSTTPIDARVQQVLEENLRDNFGNPHSNYHNYGVKAKNTVSVARGTIAEFFDVESEGVIFNSGATEANNQFIIGAALKAKREGSKRRKIFCSAVEHKCVLNSAEYTKSLGFEVFEIP